MLWLPWFQLADATVTVNTSPLKQSAVAAAKTSTPSATAPEEVKDMKVQLSQTEAEVKGERASQVRDLGQDTGHVDLMLVLTLLTFSVYFSDTI